MVSIRKANLSCTLLVLSIGWLGSAAEVLAQNPLCPPLNCTAKDLTFTVVSIVPDGSGDSTCDNNADSIDVVVAADFMTNATRYDVAIWVPDGGDIGGELTCAGQLINGATNATNVDGDACEDVAQTTANLTGASFTVPCLDADNDQVLDPIDIWASWYNSADQLDCVEALYAGTTAKCARLGVVSNIEVPAVCGDGEVNGSEDCDDGNTDDGDGCSASCTLEEGDPFCGDGNVDEGEGEECDDADASDTDACLSTCLDATCGDGFLWEGVEACDGTEGCTPQCTIEVVPSLTTWAYFVFALLLLSMGMMTLYRSERQRS